MPRVGMYLQTLRLGLLRVLNGRLAVLLWKSDWIKMKGTRT